MSKLAKVILAVVAGLTALFALILLLLNVYVQSAGVQHSIEQRLSEAIDVPVQIRRTSVSPLGGLTLAGVTIPAPEQEIPLLDSRDVSANLRVLPLLRGRVIIDEIALNAPVVTWRQTEGKWQLPHSPEAAPRESSQVSPETLPTETAVVPPPPEPQETGLTSPKPATPPQEDKSFQVEVRQVRISEGSFSFLKEDGTSFAKLDGVNIAGDIAAEGGISGDAATANLVFADRYQLTDLKAPFTYRQESLDIPALTARMADGTVRGRFSIEPEENGTPFQLKLDFEDVDVSKLLAATGITAVRASGTMNGFLELAGKARRRKDLDGRGSISIQNGLIEQYPLLQVIGRALRVAELDQMKLATAEARYTIESGNILVESLVLKSQNIQLDAKGKIDRKDDLKLDARLTLSPSITRQLPEFIENNFAGVEGSDRRYLDFEIRGTIENPKTNLVELAIGRQLKEEALDFIKQLWK